MRRSTRYLASVLAAFALVAVAIFWLAREPEGSQVPHAGGVGGLAAVDSHVEEGLEGASKTPVGGAADEARDVPGVVDGAAARGRGRVSGRVLQEESEVAVAALRLGLRSSSGNVSWVTTREDGTFEFRELVGGAYVFQLEDPSRVLVGRPLETHLGDGESIEGVRLFVDVGGVVTGRVEIAMTGHAIPDIVIEAVHATESGLPRRRGSSNAEGRFRIEGLAAGSYMLHRQTVPGYVDEVASRRVRVLSRPGMDLSGVDYVLELERVLTGRVRNASGDSIAGATVSAFILPIWSRREVETDDDGAFSLAGLAPEQTVELSARAEGYGFAPARQRVEVLAATTRDGQPEVEIILGPESTISGFVSDADGMPVEGVDIFARLVHRFHAPASQARSASDGTFRLTGLSAGKYLFELARPGSLRKRAREGEDLVLGVAEHREGVVLPWQDESMLSISGRVTDGNAQPIERATVVCTSPGEPRRQTGTRKDGSYEVRDLRDFAYRVSVRHPEFAAEQVDDIPVSARDIDFVLSRRATLEGQVVNENGDPVERFEIAHEEGDRRGRDPGGRSGFLQVHDVAGRFRLERVERGSATIWVRASGFARAVSVVDGVLPDDRISDLRIVLERASAVEGVVVDTEGRPIARARVSLGERSDQQKATVVTDANGVFKITEVTSDVRWVTAYHRDYTRRVVPFHPEVTPLPLRVHLSRGARIEGIVRVGGMAAKEVRVEVLQPTIGHRVTDETSADGRYEIKGVAVGPNVLEVRLSMPGGASRTRRRLLRVVEPEARMRIDFDFTPMTAVLTGSIEGARDVRTTRVTLHYRSPGDDVPEVFTSTLDDQGRFVFERVPAGPATINVRQDNDGTVRQNRFEVVLAEGESTHRAIRLSSVATVSGRVRGVAGAALAAVVAIRGEFTAKKLSMDVLTLLDSRLARTVTPGDDGSYRLDGLDPGEYTLLAVALDEQPRSFTDFAEARFAVRRFEVKAGDEKELSMDVRR